MDIVLVRPRYFFTPRSWAFARATGTLPPFLLSGRGLWVPWMESNGWWVVGGLLAATLIFLASSLVVLRRAGSGWFVRRWGTQLSDVRHIEFENQVMIALRLTTGRLIRIHHGSRESAVFLAHTWATDLDVPVLGCEAQQVDQPSSKRSRWTVSALQRLFQGGAVVALLGWLRIIDPTVGLYGGLFVVFAIMLERTLILRTSVDASRTQVTVEYPYVRHTVDAPRGVRWLRVGTTHLAVPVPPEA